VVTGLLVAYLSSALGRTAQVEKVVVERTAALGQSNRELREEIRRREEMEAALQQERDLIGALLDTIPDHIYFKDQQSRFLRINRAMAWSFKLCAPEDAVGRTDADFFSAEHAERALADEQEIMEKGQSLVGREEKETWPDGSTTWVSTTKQCLRDKTGQIVGTFGISRDITLRKRAERRLAVQYRIARVLAESDTFLAAAPQILGEVGGCLEWGVGAMWLVDPWFEDKRQLVTKRRIEFHERIAGTARPTETIPGPVPDEPLTSEAIDEFADPPPKRRYDC